MSIHKVSKLILFAALTVGMVGVVPVAGRGTVCAGDPHSTAYLGVMVDNVSPATAASLHLKDGSGAVITGVDQDGPACRAGLKSGDIVVAFNGKPVEGPEQFASLIHSSAPGTTVSMTVIRDGQSKEMKVTLGDWKQMAGMPKPPLPPCGKHGVCSAAIAAASAAHVSRHRDPEFHVAVGAARNRGGAAESAIVRLFRRSAEQGRAGALGGEGQSGRGGRIKAGDVIVRVNNETVHDMADWRRALKTRSGKVTLAIVRDKKEQTVEMNLPANTSKLQGEDWDGFNLDMQP